MSKRPSAAQIRGARAMLDWSMADLAEAAGVSVSTVKRVEDENYGAATGVMCAALQGALEAAGISFLAEDGGGIGLWLRQA